MVKIIIDTEILTNIIDLVMKYGEISLKKRKVVSLNIADKSISLQNEIIQLKFLQVFDVAEHTDKTEGFGFNVESISKLKFITDTVEIVFVDNVVVLKSGKLKAEIRADYQLEQFYDRNIDSQEQFVIKNSDLLEAVKKLKLPYAFYPGDPNKTPINIIASGENVVMMASDGYSLARFSTKGKCQGEVNIQLPRLAFGSFLNKKVDPNGYTTFQINEMAIRITQGHMILNTAQINESTDDFGEVLKQYDEWDVSGVVKKIELTNAIKSIAGSINDKKAMNYITCKIHNKDSKLDLFFNSSKSGGISYNEIEIANFNTKHSTSFFIAALHAKSFEDFTALMGDNIGLWLNKRAIYYSGASESGSFEYLFPTVNI